MNPKYVTTLQQSQLLQTLGYKVPNPVFYWTYCPKDKQDGEWVHVLTLGANNTLPETLPAFLLSDIIEMEKVGTKSILLRSGDYGDSKWKAQAHGYIKGIGIGPDTISAMVSLLENLAKK